MHNVPYIYGINFLEKSMLGIIPEAVIIIFAFMVLFLTFFEKLAKRKNAYYLSLIGIGFFHALRINAFRQEYIRFLRVDRI